MANNVFTNYTFKGEESEVKALKNLIVKAGKTDYCKSTRTYGKDWLGGILCEAGMSKEAGKGIPCRGSVAGYSALEYTNDGEVKFDITTMTAWEIMPAMWKAIIDKLGLKTVKIAYITDGDEGDGACKYDPIGVYSEEYFVDIQVGDDCFISCNDQEALDVFEAYFFTEETLRNSIALLFKLSSAEAEACTTESLIQKALEYEFDDSDTMIKIVKYEILTKEEAFK